MHRTLLLLALVAACSAEDRRSPPPKKPPPPALAIGTQADLAREIDAADKHGTWLELRRRWQGQTLRWTVIRQQVLCSSADACNVAAFPIMRPATHGWMPELRFAAGQYEALAARCGTSANCEVTIEGTLAKLEASDETPTRLVFEGVTLANEHTAQK
jgi:hypothetical protein